MLLFQPGHPVTLASWPGPTGLGHEASVSRWNAEAGITEQGMASAGQRRRGMSTQRLELDRFRLGQLLGEGAEFQVFAATDSLDGRPVVLKRPHPTVVGRLQHRDIEQRLERLVAAREELGEALPHVARLIGYVPQGNHDRYFGDTLGQPYTVMVEERARGVPLVGSVMDGIKGMPVGLPQNLFVLHPLVAHPQRGALTVPGDVLDVAESFHLTGMLLLDLRPQNVFFDPRTARITVVDISSIAAPREATRRRTALDLHDFFLELFRWYTAPHGPPLEASAYGMPYGMDQAPLFARDLDRLASAFSESDPSPLRTAALDILARIRQRHFRDMSEFRRQFQEYLALVARRYVALSADASLVVAWRRAASRLREPHWRKFLFDPASDLAPYGV